jgi:hypothetical protein
MKTFKIGIHTLPFVATSLALLASPLATNMGYAADASSKNLSLVFDPLTKKYFIGGSAKFTLKQGEDAGLVDRIEVSVDGGDYRSYDDSVKFKDEGKHTLKFRAVNPVNNWSPVQFVEVFVDLTHPTTEAKFPDNKFYKEESGGIFVALNSTVSLVSQDNLSGVASIEYSWDGKQFSPYTRPIDITKPGKQTLYFHGTDRVGNSEEIKKLDLVADGTAPATNLKLQGQAKPAILNGHTYVSDAMAFALESTDDASKVNQTWVSVDGKEATPYLKPIFFLQEGPHTISYWSVDNVGNKEKEKALAFNTVSTPPKTRAIGLGKLVNTGGINYATRDFQLRLEAQENEVGVDRIEVKMDQEADFKPYLEPIQFKNIGQHTVVYRAVDRAGNFEPTKVFTVDVHEQAPDTTIATAQPTVVRNGVTYSPAPNVVTFNVGNSSVGVERTLVSINDGQYVPYQGPITLTNDRKVYKISYKSVDKLGNEETPKVLSYHMISTIPVVDLFISNGTSSEEQVRTKYLEQPGNRAGGAERMAVEAPTPVQPQRAAPAKPGKRGVASEPKDMFPATE